MPTMFGRRPAVGSQTLQNEERSHYSSSLGGVTVAIDLIIRQ